MISCTEFIWVYNELFKFLEARGGEAKVIAFWQGISENYLEQVMALLRKGGFKADLA